jgi:CRP-like cAMP-binding protein
MELQLLSDKEAAMLAEFFLLKNAGADLAARTLADARCELAAYARGDVIFSAENYSRSIGFILAGSVRVCKNTPDGRRYIMNTLAPGDSFGAAAVFSDAPEYVTVLNALAPCRIVFFPQALMEETIAESPAVALNYIRFLSERVRFLNGRIQGLISASAGQALADFLLSSCVGESGGPAISLAGSISALAEKLNIGRSSLYRSFDALESRGLIARDGKNIRILDPEGLAQYTEKTND